MNATKQLEKDLRGLLSGLGINDVTMEAGGKHAMLTFNVEGQKVRYPIPRNPKNPRLCKNCLATLRRKVQTIRDQGGSDAVGK